MKLLVIMITTFLLLMSCGESPKNSSNFSTEDTRWSNGYDGESGNSNGSSSNYDGYNTSNNEFITCQMCGGSGMMVYFDGTPMSCIGCNGRGGITQAELQQMAEEMYNQGGNSSGDYYDNSGSYSQGSGRDAYQIEYELNKAYELLQSMEEAYANTDGVVVSSQYPRMIQEQKERIRQLEAELRNSR